MSKLFIIATVTASEEIQDRQACIVSKSTLVQDQVVYVVELMWFWLVAN